MNQQLVTLDNSSYIVQKTEDENVRMLIKSTRRNDVLWEAIDYLRHVKHIVHIKMEHIFELFETNGFFAKRLDKFKEINSVAAYDRVRKSNSDYRKKQMRISNTQFDANNNHLALLNNSSTKIVQSKNGKFAITKIVTPIIEDDFTQSLLEV